MVIVALTVAALALRRPDERGQVGPLMLLVATGATLVCHAVDLLTLTLGLELAGLAVAPLLIVGARGRDRGATDGGDARLRFLLAHALSGAVLLMGLALVYGATSTLDLTRLGAKLSALFTGWAAGNVQKAVEILQLPQLPIAGDPVLHLRDAAVKGSAPAALFIPGLTLVLAGFVSRLGLLWLHRGVAVVHQQARASAATLCCAVLPLAGALALVRVLPGVLNTARLVYAPYGWTVPLGTLALLSLVIPALSLVRRRVGLRRLLAMGALHNAGWIALGLIAAGDFYAHAGLRPGGLLVSISHQWGVVSGDRAVASVLLFAIATVVATVGVFAGEAALRGELRGALRRRPVVAGALAVCLVSWGAFVPLTGGFSGRAALVVSALNDNNPMVRLLVVAALVAGCVVTLAIARCLWDMLTPSDGDSDGGSSATAPRAGVAPRGALAVALACALSSVALGCGGATIWNPFVRAGAGGSLKLGAETRAVSVQQALHGPEEAEG